MARPVVNQYKITDLDGEVDPIKLLNYLYFEEDSLQQASLEQATLLMAAVRYRVNMSRKRVQMQSAYDALKSVKTLRIRRKLGEGRVREGEVTARLNRDAEVRKAKRKLDRAELDEDLAKGIVDAFRMRRDMIRTMVDLSRTDTARELWALETVAKDRKLRETATLLRSRARRSAIADDDDET